MRRVIYKYISKLMIPTPQSPQHSAKYSGKSPYFGRFESELTCSVRSLSISNTKKEVNYEYQRKERIPHRIGCQHTD